MKRSTPSSSDGRTRSIAALIAAALLVCAFIVATFPAQAHADTGQIVYGTVAAETPYYAEPDEASEAMGALPAALTFQALDMGEGWYSARIGGALCYFYGADTLVLYTSADSTIMYGTITGGSLDVLATPRSDGASLASYRCGTTIRFCGFNDEYYMAKLSDGTVCYIEAARVRLYAPIESGTLARWAAEGGARVFEAPDETSAQVASSEAGTRLYFADYDYEWLMASMTVDGEKCTVFVPKSDVLAEEPVPEPEPEPEPVETTWVIATTVATGMSEPTWDSSEVEYFRKGAVLTGAPTGSGWYEVVYAGTTMYLSADEVRAIDSSSVSITTRSYDVSLAAAVSIQDTGTWIVGNDTSNYASTEDLALYMDPDNFPAGTSGFFQFLVLTQPLGVSVSTLNAQLEGKGVLAGQGAAFSDAAYTYGVNEAYLISHALHETGNGTSTLAMGVWYDPLTETASKEKVNDTDVLVYNMYGIGAVDSNPLNGGAKYAYEQGWTSVYDAIVGGARFIARTYLWSDDQSGYGYVSTLSGQNTLYKMLYHPEWVETYGTKPWHEYATDVAWANAQTYYYTTLIADYDNYSLVFEVPAYVG